MVNTGAGPFDLDDLDPYAAGCPSRRLLDRIGDKWTVLIVGALAEGPRRVSELRRTIGGVSQKVLTRPSEASNATAWSPGRSTPRSLLASSTS